MVVPRNIYESPPGSGGNDGALPTVYIPNWNVFTNLTPQQIAAFQAFPQDLIKYIGVQRWYKEICTSQDPTQLTYITLPVSASNPNITGMQITTDVTSQQKIAGVKQAIDNGTLNIVGATFPFLAVDGVHLLSASDISAVYGYVVRYVEATYTTAASLLAQVTATPQTLTTRAPIDAAFAAVVVK